MLDRDWLLQGHKPSVIAATFGVGALGGIAFTLIGVPLGMLLGSLLSVAVLAAGRVPLFGHLAGVPQPWRQLFIPVIGVTIGAAFPTDFLSLVAGWWVSMAALAAFLPMAHFISYQAYRRIGGLAPHTAFYSAMPGGFYEAMDMGEKAGADMQMLVMLHFLRLILCIVLIPIAFTILTGQAVGSAAGVAWQGAEVPLEARDAALLAGAGLGGWFIAARLNVPAAILLGPLAASAVFHVSGLTAAVPPDGAILVTQWVIGTSLGARFAGFRPSMIWRALGLAGINVVMLLALAGFFALLVSGIADEPMQAVILGYAPGGIAEMSLVALSLQLSTIFVTLHHLMRIVLSVVVARIGMRLLESG